MQARSSAMPLISIVIRVSLRPMEKLRNGSMAAESTADGRSQFQELGAQLEPRGLRGLEIDGETRPVFRDGKRDDAAGGGEGVGFTDRENTGSRCQFQPALPPGRHKQDVKRAWEGLRSVEIGNIFHHQRVSID